MPPTTHIRLTKAARQSFEQITFRLQSRTPIPVSSGNALEWIATFADSLTGALEDGGAPISHLAPAQAASKVIELINNDQQRTTR